MTQEISQREALDRLKSIMGDTAYVEYSYFSLLRRNQWFAAYRTQGGIPVVRGQGNTLLDAVEEAERFYQRGRD